MAGAPPGGGAFSARAFGSAAAALELLECDAEEVLARARGGAGRPRGDKSAAKLARESYEGELRRLPQAPADLLELDVPAAAPLADSPAVLGQQDGCCPVEWLQPQAGFQASAAADLLSLGDAPDAPQPCSGSALPLAAAAQAGGGAGGSAPGPAAPLSDLLDLSWPASEVQHASAPSLPLGQAAAPPAMTGTCQGQAAASQLMTGHAAVPQLLLGDSQPALALAAPPPAAAFAPTAFAAAPAALLAAPSATGSAPGGAAAGTWPTPAPSSKRPTPESFDFVSQLMTQATAPQPADVQAGMGGGV